MQRESFTKALRATAKIACAASLLNVSCKNKTPAEVATPDLNQTIEMGNESISSDTSVELQDPIENEASTPSIAEYEACQPIIKEGFAEEDFPSSENVSEEVKDCCALTAEYYDALSSETGNFNVTMDWEHRHQCCSAIDWRGGTMACTPWGPPTPPSAQKMKRSIIVHQHSIKRTHLTEAWI